MKKFAVIVAGGLGMRMGAAVPKQFLLLRGYPVLWYTLETFLNAYEDLQIVLVVPVGYEEEAKASIGFLPAGGRVVMVTGGDTRFHSVRNGLAWIRRKVAEGDGLGAAASEGKVGQEVTERKVGQEATETKVGLEATGAEAGRDTIVFVHDGVRCLVSADLIRRCYEQAVELGSAVPVVDCRDSVRLVDDVRRSKPIDRSRIKMVQTPQTFRGDILLGAYTLDHQEAFTDEATVVEVAGHEVHLIEGEQTNIKITTPEDMVLAEVLLGRQ
ncbi:MAG TPA: 2-C-methyl-D-erythritol 4-phosphate cytidylyltransferase [Puia sp.]|jgi:2-C-methyl-D-erythritol 4-phosphate cytidylyltransferase|nr:2-C-methyl-D-erythritol 4-phosphate cytidylyltransferase [Puia sp.]